MKSILELIGEMPIGQWNYYYNVLNVDDVDKPFIDHNDYSRFIKRYFVRGGKVQVFNSCGINTDELRLPNHICSVFFLGLILYYNTSLHKKYRLENNDPGYSTFPFIWFLIALFHDNAYQMEDENMLKDITTIDDLKQHFSIEHLLLDKKFSKCEELIKSRSKYFSYRKNEWKVVDHGILGGILLYDRLVKIRREKKQHNEDNLFWGKKLENQYKLAANAISIHNIWLPSTPDKKALYQKYELSELIEFNKIRFKDFPLFYILAVVDTIEPLKSYRGKGLTDTFILSSLLVETGKNSIRITCKEHSGLDFNVLLDKLTYFENWLDLEIEKTNTSFKLTFK